MTALVLAEHADKPIDVLKVVKMVLIHDIVEIDAGDIFIYDTVLNHTNTEQETLAAQRIFGLLPKEQAEEFIAIWQEFEDGNTDEANLQRQWIALNRSCKTLPTTAARGGNLMFRTKRCTKRKK